MTLTAFPDRDALMDSAAQRIADALEAAIAAHGSACAALSGGSTPEPAYRRLAALPLDWPRITFALVDERFVPPSDAASNEAMLRRALAPALDAGAALAPLYSEAGSAAEAADRAEAAYAALRIDVALMGMGEDGHTASWFPGADALGAALDPVNPRSVIALEARQAAGAAARLTLTYAAITRVRRVLLLITGAAKRAKLEAVLAGRDAAPVAALFGQPPPDVLWAP